MSHQGLQILYHILNSRPGILAERCYCPDIDVEKLLIAGNLPLTSLETGHELIDFDFLGITLPYELCYTNILTILNLAGIPFAAEDRNENHPLILGGGSCSLNPEPVADFFDAILLGDGEEAIIEIAGEVLRAKEVHLAKADLLVRLAGIDGVYVPSFSGPTMMNTAALPPSQKHRESGRFADGFCRIWSGRIICRRPWSPMPRSSMIA
jgi:radical SAM superfamily enzyme YgiQ (UPF0313 family)